MEEMTTGTRGMNITKRAAIRFLDAVFDELFGNEKGSQSHWEEFCADQGLCEPWDGEEELTEAHQPPGQYEILLAAGITPGELVEFLGVNPEMFQGESNDYSQS